MVIILFVTNVGTNKYSQHVRELLSIIETQTLTYDQIVRESLYNPQTIDKVLHEIERKGQVKRIQIKNQKAEGWVICVTK
jgi:predicted Rossmann fold nucleotide-binding protein DprA/Smf involved in DNA uptake